MPGGSSTTKSVQQTFVDPNVYQALYGSGATQTVFGKKGQVKTPGATGTGGLLQNAGQLAQQPALNPLQSQALQQGANYLASPDALSGYNAMNQVGQNLTNFQNPYSGSVPNVQAAQAASLGGSAPQMGAAQGQVSNFQPGQGIDWLAIQKAIGDTFRPADVTGGGVGGIGVNWQDAATKALSGQVDNPYLTDMAKGAADVATENYLRSVAPAMRSGARMSGMYGSSRQGIAEGLAQSDLNNQVLRASTDLFGGAYENAQQRAAAMAGQMAGLDTQRDISGAQLGLQGQIANQNAALQAGQLGLNTAQGLAGYDLGRQGLGLDAASLAQQGSMQNAGFANQANQANLGASLDWAGLQQQGNLANAGFQQQTNLANADNWLQGQGLNMQGANMAAQNQLAGAGALQGASQIPFQNLQNLYGIGTQQQQAPWNQLGQYANLLYPQANLGAANTQNQTTSQQMGAGQIGMGLLGMASGGLGGIGAGTLANLAGPLAGGLDAAKSFFGGGLYTPTIYQPRM